MLDLKAGHPGPDQRLPPGSHADRDGLLRFAEAALSGERTKAIFTAIGEPAAERFLAQRIHDYLGARAIVPETGQTWEITKGSVERI